ncbi:MAG: class I SAM-dependent methyltransferase [Paludibacter sp.]|nr:class I SAM-dependent methyltransferase [Paludibacter sp.]
MQHRHLDRQQYFDEQRLGTEKFILPYIGSQQTTNNKQQTIYLLKRGTRVLEIGCGEGGNLLPFLELGCECCGVELSDTSFKRSQIFYDKLPYEKHLHLYNDDIYNLTCQDLGGTFDIVFLRDVLEHIPKQEIFMQYVKQFLASDGVLFIAFPPWRMPLGGHQQVCRNKFLCKLPYFHILPKNIYEKILKIGGEDPKGLLQIKETGISINRFKKIIRKENYEVIKKTHWFINPNYQVKFGLTPRKLPKVFQITWLQDFYTTAVYYLLKIK